MENCDQDLYDIKLSKDYDLNSEQCIEAALEKCAEDFWSNQGGFYYVWPLTFDLYVNEDKIASSVIEMEVEPRFYATNEETV